MKKIFIKSLNQLIEFDLPFKKLKFNSKNNYRQLAFNINDEIVFSINNEIFDISKFGLIIQNPFCISLNEKKLLNSLYKELEEKITNSSIVKLNEIEKESFEMLNNLLNDVDYPFEYEEKLNISKLLLSFDVKFPEIDYSNYLNLVCDYFKLYSMYCKTKIIISFGLLSLINDDEIKLLEKELLYNDLVLLDVSYCGEELRKENDLNIDNDWCII